MLIVEPDSWCWWMTVGIEVVVFICAFAFASYAVKWDWWRPAAITVASVSLLFVFSTRPVDLNKRRPYARPTHSSDTALVRAELKKANDEIQFRISEEDTWFHYKFVLVGAMLAVLFGVSKYEPLKDRAELPGVPLDPVSIIMSPTTCSVLALSCVVALAIDIHLRNNITVIQQLALWIKYYAEPALMPTIANGFVGWEEFLRIPGAGMHSDDLYGLVFYPHLHFLTWVLYVLYLGCFQTLAMQSAGKAKLQPAKEAKLAPAIEAKLPSSSPLIVAGFILVHVALAACAWVGHFVPDAFSMSVVPLGNCWQSGSQAALPYLIVWAILVAVNAPYLTHFRPFLQRMVSKS